MTPFIFFLPLPTQRYISGIWFPRELFFKGILTQDRRMPAMYITSLLAISNKSWLLSQHNPLHVCSDAEFYRGPMGLSTQLSEYEDAVMDSSQLELDIETLRLWDDIVPKQCCYCWERMGLQYSFQFKTWGIVWLPEVPAFLFCFCLFF